MVMPDVLVLVLTCGKEVMIRNRAALPTLLGLPGGPDVIPPWKLTIKSKGVIICYYQHLFPNWTCVLLM